MADASEDLIAGPSSGRIRSGSQGSDSSASSGEDELVPDFRLLENSKNRVSASGTEQTSRSRGKDGGGPLPKRGLKDFEPQATALQSESLAASRRAMHEVLLHVRSHTAKNRVIGVFNPTTGWTRVTKPRGSMFQVIGKGFKGGAVELRREEALWALESGRMELLWDMRGDWKKADGLETFEQDQTDGHDADKYYGEHDEDGIVPMSLQAAYTAYLGVSPDGNPDTDDLGLTIEDFLVYTNLKRAGFIILRPSKNIFKARAPTAQGALPDETSNNENNFFQWLYHMAVTTWGSQDRQSALGPLLRPGLRRSFQDVYKLLQLVPEGPNPRSADLDGETAPHNHRLTSTRLGPTFHIYRPGSSNKDSSSTSFRKSAPGPPDFQVFVLSARASTVPPLENLVNMFDEVSMQPTANRSPTEVGAQSQARSDPNPNLNLGTMYRNIRTGIPKRNALLAIVDSGAVSYIRVAETRFSEFGPLWRKDWAAASGGAKRGGGRARGQARGKRRGK